MCVGKGQLFSPAPLTPSQIIYATAAKDGKHIIPFS